MPKPVGTSDASSDARELELAGSVLARIAADLSMIVDRDLLLEDVRIERLDQRPAGAGQVHISFKLEIEHRGETSPGCVLVPLPDAISLAGYMMMLPDEVVSAARARTTLDHALKEALLEVGKFLAGACDAVLRQACGGDCAVRSSGCQGVRAGVRPALPYREGLPLVVARARARIHDYEPFELILALPSLSQAALVEGVSC
jgi:hypothetical protein